jgi:hypothetical protein
MNIAVCCAGSDSCDMNRTVAAIKLNWDVNSERRWILLTFSLIVEELNCVYNYNRKL